MKYLFFFLAFLCTCPVLAQSTAPAQFDSSSHYRNRPLPPMILSELRRGQKNRTLIYTDTVRGTDLARQHFNDSLEQNYADSGFSMIDTAVSLPHKDWLDSELVEIPELAHFGSHIHFNYPPSMVMETALNAVAFDSSLVQYLNPVTLEALPFFDQSPMPRPLEQAAPSESFVELGAGNIPLPRIEAWMAQSLSERSALYGDGNFEALAASQSAIHQSLKLHAAIDAQLGEDPARNTFHSQDLTIDAGYRSKTVAISNLATTDHTLSNFHGSATLTGDVSEGFHYDASVGDRDWNDNLNMLNENTIEASLAARLDVSSFRLTFVGNYVNASMTADTGNPNAPFFGNATTPISLSTVKALLGDRSESQFEWFAGVELLSGQGVQGENYSSVLPDVLARYQVNARWEIGASFEPQGQLASANVLNGIDPFYSPGTVLRFKENDSLNAGFVDARSVTMDKFNLAAFTNYMLSPDDELRLEARYITRDREPIFSQATGRDSAIAFIVTPESTERLEVTAAGNFLIFERDVLSFSEVIQSITLPNSNLIPILPTGKFDLAYHFNSVWKNIQPAIQVQYLSRTGGSFFFLDLTARAELSRRLQLSFQAENILGGPSDFWPGFPEKPRSIWASIRYIF
ncbi:MAG TPA: hypothetical protein VGM92_02315 [Candidatus Kapabacteria bacterium]|jgi:hypothetical protein